jgi:adenosylmethionine-8-amino-7-oxononanoate aminotransferase
MAAMNLPAMLREGYDAYRRYVNPLVALRAELLGEPTRLTATRDGQLVDGVLGAVEDFHGTQTFGHRHPAISQAVTEFLASDSPNWFPCRVNPYAGLLAERLCTRANATLEGPRPTYDNVFFANSGSGGVEAAIKLARAATKQPRVLSMDGAYHGCTMGSVALMKPGMFKDPFGPHVPGLEPLPFGDVDALVRGLRRRESARRAHEDLRWRKEPRRSSPVTGPVSSTFSPLAACAARQQCVVS